MSAKLIASPSLNLKSKAEELGGCVVCKLGIFTNQDWGRAPRPLIGKAHTDCGGAK